MTATTVLWRPTGPAELQLMRDHSMDAELRAELLRRSEIDQQARIACTPLFAKSADGVVRLDDLEPEDRAVLDRLHEVDRDNTAWLTDLVTRSGWPGRPLVGEDGASAAWLLAQHADRDPAFQRRCLDLMSALPESEVSAADRAY